MIGTYAISNFERATGVKPTTMRGNSASRAMPFVLCSTSRTGQVPIAGRRMPWPWRRFARSSHDYCYWRRCARSFSAWRRAARVFLTKYPALYCEHLA